MKRILIVSMLINLCMPVFAESYFEVEWSEFCPPKYADIDTTKTYMTGQARYWADRKRVFEKRLAKCNSLPQNNRAGCYSDLRDIETRATQMHGDDSKSKILRHMLINSIF